MTLRAPTAPAQLPEIILGIESSCDETAVALVTRKRQVLAQALASQITMHQAYGGVVPEVAARAHIQQLRPLLQTCLQQAQLPLSAVDAIAATCGPGLIGGVMIGAVFGKALSAALGKPFLAINHLAAHALSPRLVQAVAFPYLLLLVSGGHCQLLLVHSADRFQRLGTTIDDAAGEAFDKVAKMLGLGYPGGPAVERVAASGNAARFTLPVPMLGRPVPNFSFSGLKTAVRTQVQALPALDEAAVADMAAAFIQAVVASMTDRVRCALQLCAAQGIKPNALVAAGGVAASVPLRAALQTAADNYALPLVIPPAALCTDNAAMIAWAGHERAALGLYDDLSFAPRPRWPLDPAAAALNDSGNTGGSTGSSVGMSMGRAGAKA